MRPTRWRRSTHVLIGAAVLLVVGAVVAVAAFVTSGGPSTSTRRPSNRSHHSPPRSQASPVADSAPKPAPDRLAATLAPFVADPNLGILTGRVTDALTGAQLWAQGAGVPMQPASTNKVLTAAAALLAIDRDATLATTVLTDPDNPGLVILKGGGDPTLSAAAPGSPTWYRDAARISDLADRCATRASPSRRSRWTSAPTAGRRWRRVGSARHPERRHRPDRVGHARRRANPAGQRRVAAVRHPGTRRGPRAGRRARREPGHRHHAAHHARHAPSRSPKCSRRR